MEKGSEPLITDKTRQALEIVKAAGMIRPGEFAEKMWPNSPGWRRMKKAGNYGVTQGGGMPRAGGGFLGKLEARGLVQWTGFTRGGGYSLADGGYKVVS